MLFSWPKNCTQLRVFGYWTSIAHMIFSIERRILLRSRSYWANNNKPTTWTTKLSSVALLHVISWPLKWLLMYLTHSVINVLSSSLVLFFPVYCIALFTWLWLNNSVYVMATTYLALVLNDNSDTGYRWRKSIVEMSFVKLGQLVHSANWASQSASLFTLAGYILYTIYSRDVHEINYDTK